MRAAADSQQECDCERYGGNEQKLACNARNGSTRHYIAPDMLDLKDQRLRSYSRLAGSRSSSNQSAGFEPVCVTTDQVEPTIPALLSSLLLFLGMLIMLETGRRLGIGRRRQQTDSDRSNLGTIESALVAVFGLLMALTVTGAASRFNEKRLLIAQEVNAVQTAYLRLELLPQEQKPALQELFRRYVDSRLAAYRKMPDNQAAAAEMTTAEQLQRQIWANAVTATELPGAHPCAECQR